MQTNWLPKKPLSILENVMRRKFWPLKYRSTLVVPIVPLLADEQSQDKIRGFLCIDSPREGRFNKTVDVDILRGVSDGLFNQIDKLYQLVTTQNSNGEIKNN